MAQKSFNLVVGFIFLAIAVLHLLRVVLGWEAAIGGSQVPMWVSVVAVVAAGFLGSFGFTMYRRASSGKHYICTGGCGGVSKKPGVCEAPVCTRKGMPLEECCCVNGTHGK